MKEILFKAKRIDNGEIEGTELTLINYITPRKALFRCSCGNETIQHLCDIEREKVKSCGCKRYRDLLKRNQKHGEAGTRLYRIWRGIKTRCQNPNHKDYADYGMRGISICNEWNGRPYIRHDILFWVQERELEVIGNIFDNKDLIGE